MPQLVKNIFGKDTKYEEGIHYIFFSDGNLEKITKKKSLYLTIQGFRRVLEVSRIKMSPSMKNILHAWNNNLDSFDVDSYNVDIEDSINKTKQGYVYCVSSEEQDYVKIGSWKSTLELLRTRYIPHFGNNLELFYVHTRDALELERKCQKYFNNYNIKNKFFKLESFEKEQLEQYKAYLEENKEEIEYNINPIKIIDDKKYFGTKKKLLKQIDLLTKELELKNKDLEIKDRDIQLLKQQNENLNLKLQLAQMKQNKI
jgi:uncharacterized protein YnzC (UPF0291/DUF896 family)